jgi:hypothetical protein
MSPYLYSLPDPFCARIDQEAFLSAFYFMASSEHDAMIVGGVIVTKLFLYYGFQLVYNVTYEKMRLRCLIILMTLAKR